MLNSALRILLSDQELSRLTMYIAYQIRGSQRHLNTHVNVSILEEKKYSKEV